VINRVMIRAARRGQRVVRLKGGDPFVFGRGGEEALALTAAGVPWEVVPGVTTAVAAAELAHIPVTHRGVASGFLVLAGHTEQAVSETLQGVRPNTISIVFMMAVSARARLAEALSNRGWLRDTPAALVCNASLPNEWVWTGPLSALGTAAPPPEAAGVLVIGEVVKLRHMLVQAARPRLGAVQGESYVGNR
jgi:uroporphyrin-III C-methyltransferase/precorrin-2 dehydrogenase/sirohydrochlorin ferrochelatase